MREKGILVEYQSLRNEIIYSDRVCTIILGLLIAFSGTILGFVIEKSKTELLAVLPPIWFIGWLYISEKRFLVRRISSYLRHAIEHENLGLGWQRWLGRTRIILDKYYPRFDPYILESIVSLVASFGATLILGMYSKWNIKHLGLWTSIAACLLLAFIMIRNNKLYRNHHNLFDELFNIDEIKDNKANSADAEKPRG